MERGNYLGNSGARNRLNPAFVAAVRPADHTRRHGDGNGLFLVVRPTGAKSWMQRLTVDGRPRDIGLGSLRDVSLKEARAVALENRRVARRGGDPTRRRPDTPTFAEAFDARGGAQAADVEGPRRNGGPLAALHGAPRDGPARGDAGRGRRHRRRAGRP